jgi:hypothetical protein
MWLPLLLQTKGLNPQMIPHERSLNANITMDDSPYSIMLTHHHSVRHA